MNSFMTTLLGALLSRHDQLAVAMLIRARGRFFCLALRTSLQRHHLRRAPSAVQQIGRRAGCKEPLQHLGVASACSRVKRGRSIAPLSIDIEAIRAQQNIKPKKFVASHLASSLPPVPSGVPILWPSGPFLVRFMVQW